VRCGALSEVSPLYIKMASRKRYTIDVLQELGLSDDEYFDEIDDDRDSYCKLDDVGPVSDADSETNEADDNSVAGDCNANSNPESGRDAAVPVDSSASLPVKVEPRFWERVNSNYTSNMEFEYRYTAGLNSSVDLTAESSPIDFFNLFLTEEVISLMVNESNRYADQFLEKSALKRKARAHNWRPTKAPEMKRFLGLVFLMGCIKKPRIEDYWSTDPTIATPIFNRTMQRDRFELILKFWHYCNNEELPDDDRQFKLRHIIDMLISRFQAVYTLERDISIDEAMVLWRGRLTFRQFIPGRCHKYGVKLYLLCEPSGYVYNLLVYCGKMDAISGFGHAETVVLTLMDNILDRGHVLYTDNFYTSVPLAEQLLNRQTYLCGTLRRNHEHLPEAVVTAQPKRNDAAAWKSGQITVLKWNDKRDIIMLSTAHAGRIVEGSRRNRSGNLVKKPDCLLAFNDRMCSVDRLDQLFSDYSPLRKTLKWYRKVVLQVLDMAMSNAFLLYRKCGGNRRLVWFRSQVIRCLIATQDRPTEVVVATRVFFHHKASDLSRLTGQHYMDILPPTECKKSPTSKCVVCYKRKRRRETRYICGTCASRPALCIVPCFKEYHSKADF